MKRLLFLLLLVFLAAGAVWLLGRAPTPYWIEREVERFQEERRLLEARLATEVHRAEARGEKIAETRARYRRRLYTVAERKVRGWSVLFLPAGAARPAPRDYLVFGTLRPAREDDPLVLRGPVEVWFAPRGLLARLLFRLKLSP